MIGSKHLSSARPQQTASQSFTKRVVIRLMNHDCDGDDEDDDDDDNDDEDGGVGDDGRGTAYIAIRPLTAVLENVGCRTHSNRKIHKGNTLTRPYRASLLGSNAQPTETIHTTSFTLPLDPFPTHSCAPHEGVQCREGRPAETRVNG